MAKSRVNLIIEWDGTADTPRIRATEIAERVRNFVAADMDAANTTVRLDGAFLDYRVAYEADRESANEVSEHLTRRERAAALLTDIDIDGILSDEPTCDICGATKGNSPILWSGDTSNDWNAETGNHLSCEGAS